MVSKCIEWEIDRALLKSIRFRREQLREIDRRVNSDDQRLPINMLCDDDNEPHVDDCWTIERNDHPHIFSKGELRNLR